MTRAVAFEKPEIKIGSIVHLKNQYSNDAGYLDAWGRVKDKPEFSQVATELKFVSTHRSPNRENGSGSWKIVSATGKEEVETLVYGDEIHLLNMYPGAGYLDNCGWLKDMPVFKDYVKVEKFAVFTTRSKDRDNGTGITEPARGSSVPISSSTEVLYLRERASCSKTVSPAEGFLTLTV